MAKKKLVPIDCLVGLYNHLNYQKELLTLFCQNVVLSLAKVEESMKHDSKIKKQQEEELITRSAVEINLDQVEELIQKAQRVFVNDDLITRRISSHRKNPKNNTIQKSTGMGKQVKVSKKNISSQFSCNRKSIKSSATSNSEMPSRHSSSISTTKSSPEKCSKALIHEKEKKKIVCTRFVKKVVHESTSNQIESIGQIKAKGSYQKEFLEKQKELVNLKSKYLKATSDIALNKETGEKKEEFVKHLYKRKRDNKDFLSEYSSGWEKDIADSVTADFQREIDLIEECCCRLYEFDSLNQHITQEKLFGIIKMKELEYKKILSNVFNKDCEQSIQTFQQITALTLGNEVFPVIVIDDE